MPDIPAHILTAVEAAYARTHERLKDEPEYIRLKASADAEEAASTWSDRNRFSLYIEANTPMEVLTRAEAEDPLAHYPQDPYPPTWKVMGVVAIYLALIFGAVWAGYGLSLLLGI